MITIFQVVLDGTATRFNFSIKEKSELVDKMRELQKQFTESVVTFLEIDL